jgi:acyl carrier protein
MDYNIEKIVVSIASTLFRVPQGSVLDSSSFISDLGADSLDILEFVMELEANFDIAISEAECESMETVGDAMRIVRSALDRKQG